MKKILKTSIQPIFIGFSFYLFILLAHNTQLISKDYTRTWSTIIAGVLLMYIFVYAAINKKESINIGVIGFCTANILFSIIIPLIMIFNNLFFELPKRSNSLLEKHNIELISISSECYSIKYGTFKYGIDTIIRYSKDNKDYELIKVVGLEEKLNNIQWLDSCSYVRIINNNSIDKYIRLGNIEGDSHDMYEKPAITHEIKEESIKTLTKIKQ